MGDGEKQAGQAGRRKRWRARQSDRSTERFRAVAAIVLLVSPLLLAALYLSHARLESAREEHQLRALTLARAVAAQHAVALADGAMQLERLSARIAGNEDPFGCEALLAQSLELQPLFYQMAVADRHGYLGCAGKPIARAVNVADRAYFQRSLAEGGFRYSELLQGRVSGRWTVVAAHPVSGGVLLAAVELGWVERALSTLSLPPGSIVSIVDRQGRLLARAPHVASLVGTRLREADAFAAAVRSRAEGFADSAGLDGIARRIAYSRIGGTDLFVRVGIPVREVQREGRAALLAHLAATALAAALALLAGFAAYRSRLAALGATAMKLGRALRTLSAGNRTLLRERSERELLQAMCEAAVRRGGYVAAYVCYARHDEARSIEVMAKAGADRGFIGSVKLTWADTEAGRGSIGRCIRSGEHVIVHAILEDAGAAPWHEAARARGLGSIISLPLRVQGQLIGTFTLAAAEEDAFDGDELALLDEMAADLAFGIENIRAEGRRREAEAIARHALLHDTVVDLPNRAAFVQRVNEEIAAARASGEPLAVLDLHLGRLQDLFDSFGYEPTNAVLREIAGRLKALPAQNEALGRLPVDDFGLVQRPGDGVSAAQLAERVRGVFAKPVRIGEALVDLQASIGVAFYPGHGEDGEGLVRRAGIAAREGFRKDLPFLIFTGTTRENPARLALAADLRSAVEARELTVSYQPKIRLSDGAVSGAEALVRWRHPARGMVPPGEFVPLAEDIGLIRPLTYQVLELAIRQQHAWRDAAAPRPIAINLSARNLYDPAFLDAFDRLVATWGVARELLHFEITEGALVDDPETARRVLIRLRDAGSKIYIDDFGTGYSSLSYLVALPVHALKVDRSFIRQMASSEQARSVVSSIISMSHNLHVRVVAEGVETAEDEALLRSMGCDEAQGYYYATPMPAADYEAWCAKRERS